MTLWNRDSEKMQTRNIKSMQSVCPETLFLDAKYITSKSLNQCMAKRRYKVDEYLSTLRLAGRSEKTIELYRKVLVSYAKVIGVSLDEIHNHLSPGNLLKYVGTRKGMSEAGLKTNLQILERYMKINGVKFDEMQSMVMRAKRSKLGDDKPLELASLQKMMDLTDTHGKAIISFLISTGCRAGETSELLLSDVKGDCVHIRKEIAKGGHGGYVYLTAEAREYLDQWLKERDEYIKTVDERVKGLTDKNNPHPARGRPKNDNRLFAMSYHSMFAFWTRLYKKVDGSRGKYHALNTLHSCRKYFRTNAVRGGMSIDLVDGIMRHTGAYLSSSYVRMSEQEKRDEFHKYEAALYITRADHRIQDSKLSKLDRENRELKARLEMIEGSMNRILPGTSITIPQLLRILEEKAAHDKGEL